MMNECSDPRGWAIIPVDEVKVGDVLIADGGFPCLRENQNCLVRYDTLQIDGVVQDALYVTCDEGQHFLDGQLDDTGENYVGFWKEKALEKLQRLGQEYDNDV
jgi:hypothetical protein